MPPLSILELARVTEDIDAKGALDNARDLALHAESLGYRRIWVAEHHNMRGIASAATSIVIAHIAAGTSTIRVGAGGIGIEIKAAIDLLDFPKLLTLTVIVLMTVVRPLLKQVLAADNSNVRAIPSFMRNGAVLAGPPGETGDPAGNGRAMTVGADGAPLPVDVDVPPSERMLAIAQVKGQLKAQSVEKIGALVSQNPADSVAVLRSWIHEKSAA